MTYPFVQAKNYTPGPRTRGRILWLVVHDMEALESPNTAENCAAYFANQRKDWTGSFGSSAHYCHDVDSIVQSVRDSDIAWAAPGANAQGLHFEFAGYASQDMNEWLDDYGIAMLRQGAALFAEKAAEYDIPLISLTPGDVRAGRPGITSHRTITAAFNTIGGHTDPGPEFPVDVFMGFVAEAASPAVKSDPVPRVAGLVDFEEDDMRKTLLGSGIGLAPFFVANPRWDPGFGRPPVFIAATPNGLVQLRSPIGAHVEGNEVVLDIGMIDEAGNPLGAFDIHVVVA